MKTITSSNILRD